MSTVLIDEGHVGPFVTTQLVAEPRHELQPAGAAADDNDAMEIERSRSTCISFRTHRLLPAPGQGHSAASRVSTRALVCAASTTANAVMLRIAAYRRGLRQEYGRTCWHRAGLVLRLTPPLAATPQQVEGDVGRVQTGHDQEIGFLCQMRVREDPIEHPF